VGYLLKDRVWDLRELSDAVTVEKHVKSILMKRRIPASQDDHRRVLAVLAHLGS
jgi:hypothetical protein